MWIEVTFTPAQRDRAITEAHRRNRVNAAANRPGRNGGPPASAHDLRIDYAGAGGELAVAILLGLEDHVYVNTQPVHGSADLPGNIDVKTGQAHHHRLIVQRDDDHSKKRYVLATVDGTIRVHGWIEGHNVCRREWWKDPHGGRPAFFVPQDALRPIETLITDPWRAAYWHMRGF